MQVLVTRAHIGAMRTAEQLAVRGHHAIVSPVLEMAATDAAWPRGVVDALIATSAQAFDLLKCEPEWPLPEAKRLLPLFLVGERTAEAARARGFTGPMLVAPDVQELTKMILYRRALPPRRLYIAGRDRKPDLETCLNEAHLGVETIEVYEARAAASLTQDAIEGLAAGTVDAVLHYSRRSAEIFLNLAEMAGLPTAPLQHMAISSDAAQPLRDAGLPYISVAAEPNDEAVLALLDE
jgi:uroporphyrinogen-III synthase